MVKTLPANAGDIKDAGSISVSGDLLEKEVATHSSSLVWEIRWVEENGRLLSLGLQRVGHDLATDFHFHFYIYI